MARFYSSIYIKQYRISVMLLAGFFLAGLQTVFAQLSPMGAIYYQNQYLINPALAGAVDGLTVNGGYRTQWNNIPGSPTVQTFTADFSMTDKVGLGLSIYNDKSGLYKRTSTVASYAYRLPLNSDDSKLSFGLSLGFLNERINTDDVNADPNDVVIRDFNDRETYIDGSFGMAYSDKSLRVQAALPNMKNVFRKEASANSIDKNVFFTAISYKIMLREGTEGFDLEPKLVFRGIKGFDNIVDAGANLSYAGNKINFFSMYHTSRSASFGLGFSYMNAGINSIYTINTSDLRGYSTGDFEINLSLRLFKKKPSRLSVSR